jgi:hypothetical protein
VPNSYAGHNMKNKSKYSEPDNSGRRVPDLKKGKYADSHPLDEVKYLEHVPAGAHYRRNHHCV